MEAAVGAAPTSPLQAPPAPWWTTLGGSPAGDCPCSGEAGCSCHTGENAIPGPGWPPIETVEYMTKLIVLGLLLLALPWLLAKVVSSPGDGMRIAGHAVGMK